MLDRVLQSDELGGLLTIYPRNYYFNDDIVFIEAQSQGLANCQL